MRKVYLVHRWDGSPNSDWYPWLEKELEKKNFEINILEMPSPENPKIETWINFLKENIKLNEETYLIGHSVGCQTILRYFEQLNKKVKGAILVAPWLHLQGIEEEGQEVIDMARPWLETPIDFDKIKTRYGKLTCIFSNNDPYVPLSDKDIFKAKLNAKIIIEENKGHFTEEDLVTKLPSVVNSLMEMVKPQEPSSNLVLDGAQEFRNRRGNS